MTADTIGGMWRRRRVIVLVTATGLRPAAGIATIAAPATGAVVDV
ncbi:hypothetical protein [Undibacter mobilis]|nr:hypothetical protein [Undibacter mobilis]